MECHGWDMDQWGVMVEIAFATPRLSAVLVVKDQAHCLEQCLRSIRSIADEIIVIDSGSTDGRVAIARAFGARVEVSDWPGFGAQKIAPSPVLVASGC